MKNVFVSAVVVFFLTIPLFGQQAVFVALRASDEANRKTNSIEKTSSITNTISCEGIIIEGLVGDIGWIKNIGNAQRRVRIVNQYLNAHNAGAELTLSMDSLGHKEKIRINFISRNMVFYVYSGEGGLLGFIKANKLSEKESGWFQ